METHYSTLFLKNIEQEISNMSEKFKQLKRTVTMQW